MSNPRNRKKSTSSNNARVGKSLGSRYDVYIKKVMEDFSKEILETLLGVEISSLDPVDRELPSLKVSSRHVDFLAWVSYRKTPGMEERVLLHVEFQSRNDRNMVKRMLRYGVDVWEKYGQFPVQVVVYLGGRKLSMKNSVTVLGDFSVLNYFFKIVDLSTVSYLSFLDSESPDVVILSLLGSMEGKEKEDVLFEVLLRLRELCVSAEELRTCVVKLEMISELRGLSPLVYKKVSEVFGLDIRELGSYKLGRKEGRKEGEEEGVKKGMVNLILLYLEDHFEFRKEELEQIRSFLFKMDEERLNSLFKEITHKKKANEIRELLFSQES